MSTKSSQAQTNGFLCSRDWLTILPLPWGEGRSEGEGISCYAENIFDNQSISSARRAASRTPQKWRGGGFRGRRKARRFPNHGPRGVTPPLRAKESAKGRVPGGKREEQGLAAACVNGHQFGSIEQIFYNHPAMQARPVWNQPVNTPTGYRHHGVTAWTARPRPRVEATASPAPS